jgi:hypothetical protein
MRAFGVLRVGGYVESSARVTVCESRNASLHKTVNVKRDRSYCDRFVTGNYQVKLRRVEQPLLRVRLWLEKLQPKIGKPLIKLTRQPRARSKSADEKSKLGIGLQMCRSRDPPSTYRVHAKDFCEVGPDGIHRGLNRRFEKS